MLILLTMMKNQSTDQGRSTVCSFRQHAARIHCCECTRQTLVQEVSRGRGVLSWTGHGGRGSAGREVGGVVCEVAEVRHLLLRGHTLGHVQLPSTNSIERQLRGCENELWR